MQIKPLTILVGPNGSGKSSILEVLALLSQSIPERGNPLTLDGNLIKIPSYKDVFSRRTYTHPLHFEISISLDDWEYGQCLSVITEYARLAYIILVEEPEVSLHPEAQVLLPELFADIPP